MQKKSTIIENYLLIWIFFCTFAAIIKLDVLCISNKRIMNSVRVRNILPSAERNHRLAITRRDVRKRKR